MEWSFLLPESALHLHFGSHWCYSSTQQLSIGCFPLHPCFWSLPSISAPGCSYLFNLHDPAGSRSPQLSSEPENVGSSPMPWVSPVTLASLFWPSHPNQNPFVGPSLMLKDISLTQGPPNIWRKPSPFVSGADHSILQPLPFSSQLARKDTLGICIYVWAS